MKGKRHKYVMFTIVMIGQITDFTTKTSTTRREKRRGGGGGGRGKSSMVLKVDRSEQET